ncbi:uncharacterized protein DNG_09311 [Cephalotrichum gorgonifer]|uniref:VOC domain-containing protein n=1 Tax=Cephalotrichum gorgonifer TaxID=2041049 RepID=A0AAE8N5F1_9PEZI|nr:uncharacterized protein DNG_09311 [Cephalotrichum gorgonifer]
MDSLAVATAVVQFVQFTSGLIAKGIAIHSSAAGLTVDCDELATITKSLSQSSEEIRKSLEERAKRRRLTGNENDLEKIAVDCQKVADELVEVLGSLTLKSPRTKWRSFRHALRATWNEGKVKSLEDRIDRFREQMMVNFLISLRQEADRSIREQSSVKESVERIEQLQRSSISVGDRFVRQIMDGEQWRRDLIQMIHEQGQGSQSVANLNKFKDDNGWTPNAVVAHERRIRERILHKLAFRNIADRERRISKAHRRTFEWIFCDPESDTRPWSSFKDFLEHQSKKIYWITGKPGSGKSTLMKFIQHHPQTNNLLRTWSGDDEVIRAAFYFWNSGSRMQMSVGGLLQTILHDCLRQLPQVVHEVLPERWEAATLFDVDDFPWSWEEVSQALRRLITEVCPKKKFFVMIDGLDECSGNQAQLIELITELAEDTENLKLCVASRPWNNFEDAFKHELSLMLQDLSASDIEWYIESKFTANEGFAEFQVRDPWRAEALLKTLSKKAEGVFLWVHLVVQSLLEGLINGDGPRDLYGRLEELPPNLEDLYTKILENLDDKYLDHASRLFQIVRACDDSPTLLRVALADLEDDERAMQASIEPMSNKEKSALCKNMKRKLASRCRGLLDISSPVPQRADDGHPASGDVAGEDHDWLQAGEADDEVCGTSMADLEVQYLHRSVRDYIQSSEMWSWLVSATEEPFNPYTPLFKSHLLQLKSLHPVSLSAQKMGFHIWMAIKYAKRSLNLHTKKMKEHVKEVVLLLDEIDKAATILTSSPARANSTFADRSGILGDNHWSSFFLIRVSGPSFPHVMAVCGVHQYLEMRLQSSDLKEEEGDYDVDTGGSDKTPLMIAALDGAPMVPVVQGYDDLLGPHREVLKALLRNGGNCHKLYHGRSAWDLARNADYPEILELFEEYRGKPPPPPLLDDGGPNSRNSLDRRESPTTRRGDGNGTESDNESNASTEALTGLENFSDIIPAGRTSSPQGRRRNRPRNDEAISSLLSRNAPSGNERRPGHQRNRSSPHLTPEESQYPTYGPPLPQSPVGPQESPTLQPRPSLVQYYSLPFQAFYDTRPPEDGDDDEGDYYQHRSFHRRPVNYWRGNQPGMAIPTMPPQPYRSSPDYGKLCWLEIPVRSPDRASAFYTSVLGWSASGSQPTTTPGAKNIHFFSCGSFCGAFLELEDGGAAEAPAAGTVGKPDTVVPSFCVESIDETLGKVVEGGGKVDVPKTMIGSGEMGFYARFVDTEGNVQGLWSQK